MMHTLIAGVTGSGKSYTEHILISKLKGRMILLDPKRVELRKYKDDPRCACYANDLDGCTDALHEAEEIMDGRYRQMEHEGKSNYDGLPVYVIVDETAALMNADKRTRKECEKMLYNLTFLGRAAKVYVILCTQRSTADVIPRKISVNLENKICLRQQKPVDSRELIGIPDACELPKIGKCYLYNPDMRRPERMTPEEAVEKITKE